MSMISTEMVEYLDGTDAIEMYNAGMSYKSIGKAVSVDGSTIGLYIRLKRANGKALRKCAKPLWTDEDLQKLVKLYKAGKKRAAIAAALGRSAAAVSRKLFRVKRDM